MWTYFLGPFLSLLPKRWRKLLPIAESVKWARATFLSGLAEFAIGVYAWMYWYSYLMTAWVDRGVEVALSGKASGITDHAIGAAALLFWANHPLTWVIAYFCVEGAVRLCGAAFTETILGTLPLFLVDKIFARTIWPRKPGPQDVADGSPGNVSSFLGAIGEKVLVAGIPKSSDQLRVQKSPNEEILEIRSSRRKPEWTPPRVVRYLDNYYRLEACSRVPGARPFRYTLRRLPAGVPGRNVLVYSPD